MENQSSTLESTEQPEQSQKASEKVELKAVLAEARNTREVLIAFKDACESGSYHGSKMLALAKGLAFVDAILNQNTAHIKNLQERIGA